MRSKNRHQKREPAPECLEPNVTGELESPPEQDDWDDIDGLEPIDGEELPADDPWDVFLFDDDSEALPGYGDFWLPD